MASMGEWKLYGDIEYPNICYNSNVISKISPYKSLQTSPSTHVTRQRIATETSRKRTLI